MRQIPSFVITGGDCAGKSTGLSRIRDHLATLGYTVLIAPEAATSLIGSGIIPGKIVPNELFQELIFRRVISNEKLCMRVAKSLRKTKPIILCDRGLMDGLAYTTPEHFAKLCRKFRGDVTRFRDARYLAVMHLRTAALGAEEHYTYENNPARFARTLDEVRRLDECTMNAWVGHPHLRVIPNKRGNTFDDKINHLIKEICHVLGEPVPLEIERKFLVEMPDLSMFPHFARIEIIQDYLTERQEGVGRRIRARGQSSSWVFTETAKQKLSGLARSEIERTISEEDYRYLRTYERDPKRATIRKQRNCFVWEHQYFELDVFQQPALPHALLEIELTHEGQTVVLPPFLKIIREVSNDPKWQNSAIAKRIPV